MSESKYRAKVIASGLPDPGSSISGQKYKVMKQQSKYNRLIHRFIRGKFNPATGEIK